MGCGPSENVKPGANSLKIWGDYFSQDTRALLAIRDMAEAGNVEFIQINTLNKENLQSPFIDQNPNATIPMLTHGHTKVIGDAESIFNYIVNTDERVSDKFFHEEQAKKISEILSYFTRTVRRTTSKLIQAVVVPIVNQTKRRMDNKRIEQCLTEFFVMILPKINGYLSEDGYVTGPKISIVDIMLYCELQTICTMYKRDINPSETKLANWRDRLSQEVAL